MKKKTGIVCLVIGIILLAVSGKKYLEMKQEENEAGFSSAVVLEEMQRAIGADEEITIVPEMTENPPSDGNDIFSDAGMETQETDTVLATDDVSEAEETPAPENAPSAFSEEPVSEKANLPFMKTMEIDGYEYIGYLELPTLGLSLPVMDNWDYKKLKTAPCRWWGTPEDDNLIILAHNYDRHFGHIVTMQIGDIAQFVDVDGNVTTYAVTEVTTMEPDETAEMMEKAGDLTLFTCTKGGKHRVTVRLERVV